MKRLGGTGLLGLVLIGLLICGGVFAPLLAPEKPGKANRQRLNEPPRWTNLDRYSESVQARRTGLKPDSWLGRDMRGRDVLSQVLYGARTSLLVGALVVTLAGAIGITLGALAGYLGGWFDAVVMRVTDVVLAFPFLILALAAVSIFPRATLWHVAVVLGLTFWPPICRLTRAQVLAMRQQEFVAAVHSLGASHSRILLGHILPNCVGPIITWFAMSVAAAIMGEASLSFLGLGDPDSTSWGTMIFHGISRMNFPEEWWAALFPALALALAVLGFNLLGDALQKSLSARDA